MSHRGVPVTVQAAHRLRQGILGVLYMFHDVFSMFLEMFRVLQHAQASE